MKLELSKKSHRRYNPLTGEWVLVSPQRTSRPWQGKVEEITAGKKAEYDPRCYLCPGNERVGGKKNPVYEDTFVFENDYSALNIEKGGSDINVNDLIISEDEPGICKVVCFSPKHNLTLAEMEVEKILAVVDTWVNEFKELGKRAEINYIQIFENKGEIMGCSNPHPHSQIWATHSVPIEPLKETIRQENFLKARKSCLLCDYLKLETELGERLIIDNDDFAVVVPFWSIWPFETIIISKRHIKDISGFSAIEKKSFAAILKEITSVYDKVFDVSFPYSAGIHQAPTDGKEYPGWHFHYHFYPPLLRSAVIKKFMVGFEMLAEPQKDFAAETGAQVLRKIAADNMTAAGKNNYMDRKEETI